MEMLTKNLKETQDAAREFVEKLPTTGGEGARVIALYGDLGSGKTSFVQGVAKALGIDNTVISPTFVIERIYPISHAGFTHLIHIDAYRLEEEGELLGLGWEKIVADPKNLIFVEWAERIERILPKEAMKIHFEYIDETTRKIKTTN